LTGLFIALAFNLESPHDQIDALRKALEAYIDKGFGKRRWEGFVSFVLNFRSEVNSKQLVHITPEQIRKIIR
jgi:hypothetical protein